MKKIELLAPAKDYYSGVAAIDCGADAVYIGAPKYSARYSAGVSCDDIEKLCRYAHLYGVKVYVALNTILFDDEIEEARRIAFQMWEIGVDALIVQDMAFCKMSLPPIVLHASTQTANLTPHKVRFLQDVGFTRVILERALSVDDIKAIRSLSDVELECFVHGAICVSYSGQCYMSHVVANRSGNRGVCSQPCRSTYNLYNEKGELLLRDKHLLSVKDLSLEDHLKDMIDSGVVSFKIEGRLKDVNYVKNSVSYYNKLINDIVSADPMLIRASEGSVSCDFAVDPKKSFNREFTSYFIGGTAVGKMANFDTAKAVGCKIGVVTEVEDACFKIDSKVEIANGDGVCFVRDNTPITGANINKVIGDKIFPNRMDGILVGAAVFRNFDKNFNDTLDRYAAKRLIDINVALSFDVDMLNVIVVTSCGTTLNKSFDIEFQQAKNIEKSENTIISQMSKSGDYPFKVLSVKITGEVPFIPISIVNNIRRTLLDELVQYITNSYQRQQQHPISRVPYITQHVDYKSNVVNKLSYEFYKECGCESVEYGVETKDMFDSIEVMRTKYCLRREIGECLKTSKNRDKLFLENNRNIFEVKFDCAVCEMALIYKDKKLGV